MVGIDGLVGTTGMIVVGVVAEVTGVEVFN